MDPGILSGGNAAVTSRGRPRPVPHT